mgnify:CR=1 FL=1
MSAGVAWPPTSYPPVLSGGFIEAHTLMNGTEKNTIRGIPRCYPGASLRQLVCEPVGRILLLVSPGVIRGLH